MLHGTSRPVTTTSARTLVPPAGPRSPRSPPGRWRPSARRGVTRRSGCTPRGAATARAGSWGTVLSLSRFVRTQNLAIVFTDVKGFSEAAARGSLEENQARLEKLAKVLSPVFEAFHGRVVKAVSDSFLVVFESPTLAVLAAAAAQDELWKNEVRELRVGVSVGEVGLEANDVLGEPVAAASALRESAEAGEVKLTEAVYLVMNRAEVKAEPAGRHGEQAVFRVPRAATGAPYGGQGMLRVPGVPTGELGTAMTASALKAIRSSKVPLRAAGIAAALAAIVLVMVLVGKTATGPPPLQKAIDEVRTALPAERSGKIVAAQALIAQEKEASRRDYWYGKLQAAQDDENAAAYFRSAVRAGYAPAEDSLIGLLDHPKCRVRIGAIEAISELKLGKAAPALTRLSTQGGPDDTERVLFFGCNSKAAAAEALSHLAD